MEKTLEQKLAKKFPKLFRDLYGDPKRTLMNFGCDVRDGWYQLIEECCQKLTDANCDVVLAQVKEKFGILTIYVFPRTDEETIPEKAFEICSEIADKSKTICEYCGKPGKLRTKNRYWIQTLCNNCNKKQNYVYREYKKNYRR